MSTNNSNDKTAYTSKATEPSTGHDVKEGGAIGAVGGAVVGLMAGGPVGAVVGAVIGGAASAAAVNVVDKHDHDYARTATDPDEIKNHDVNSTTANTGYADTATSTYATAPTSDYVDSTSSRSYAAAPTADRYDATRVDGDEAVIPVVEEELEIGKREVQGGTARIHTNVVETPVDESINLREEHVTIDRRPVDRAVTDADLAFKEQVYEVTETDEVPVVAKNARVVEEVVIGKTATERVETVHDTVRRTEVDIDQTKADRVVDRDKATTY